MGILGTSESEEQALRAAAPAGRKSRLNSSSTMGGSSAYETASEFSDGEYEAREYQAGPEYQREKHFGNGGPVRSNPHNAYTTNSGHRIAPSESASTIHASPDAFVKDTPGASLDENAVRPINGLDVESPVLTENELNRYASTHTERSIDAAVVRSITRGEPVKLSDLDYDGPDDKDNPHNWPSWKKWTITFTIACMCLCISLGSSLYVEGVSELQTEFHMSQTLAISGLSFYLLGLAFGPIVGAPVSEMIGRRLIYITTFPAAILFTMGVGLSQNGYSVLILRFFCGLISSPPLAIAGGSISDLWANAPEQLSSAMVLFCLAPFLGPVIGPIVGGFVAENKSWRWTMWVSMMFYGAVLPFVLWAPETFKRAILKKRAKKRGIKLIVERPSLKEIIQVNLYRPLEMLFVEPIVGFSSVYIAFVFAVLFGFFEAFPIIFRGVYGMDHGVSGLPFIAVGVGLVLAVFCFVLLDKFYYFPKNPDGTRGRRDEEGKIIWDAPETRLLVVEIGAFFLPIGLFWLAWTSRKSVHWIVPTISAGPFGVGLLWIFFGIILYYSMSFPPAYVASAMAANNFLRYLVAGAFPLFMVQMYDRLHIDWATSLLAFISVAMIPIPFAFHKWGPQLRSKSKYGYVAMFRRLAEEKAAAEAQGGKDEGTDVSGSQDIAEKV